MKAVAGILLGVVIAATAVAVAALWYARDTGLTARGTASGMEVGAARRIRAWAIPDDSRERRNPVTTSTEVIASGRAHFADHCASCHANDGSGNVQMGRNLFPRSPDMRAAPTQSLTDGELFWIIENGIRFTGMPGWSTGTPEGEQASWELVHFIRHLPNVTPAELELMEGLNPRSPREIRQELEAERFLAGEDPVRAPPAGSHVH